MNEAPAVDLFSDYADGRRMLAWTGAAAGLAVLAVTRWGWGGWIALSLRLWIAYSAGHVALWLLRRRTASPSRRSALAALVAATLAGTLAGVVLAPDFVADRLHSATWLAQRSALPMVFGLALHIPTFLLRWREARRHRQRLAAAHADAAREALQRQLTLAELKTLQAQVEPHFLYNTLASVQRLVRHDPARADEMLDHLHEHLRQSLPAMRADSSTLGREVQLARSYLSIMRIRLGERLAFRIDLPEPLADAPFPPMMLSTLVENAVKHGIEPSPRGGTVCIAASRGPAGIEVTVDDDGIGLGGSTGGSGLGLSNVRERLRALHADAASLDVIARTSGGVRARLLLPE